MDRELVERFTRESSRIVGSGVFSSQRIHKRQIEIELEQHHLAANLSIPLRIRMIEQRDCKIRLGTEMLVLSRTRFHAQEEMLPVPREPHGVDLGPSLLVHRGQMTRRRAVQDIVKLGGNVSLWHVFLTVSSWIAPPARFYRPDNSVQRHTRLRQRTTPTTCHQSMGPDWRLDLR